MRITTVLKRLLGLCPAVVVRSWQPVDPSPGAGRPRLVVAVRTKAGRRGRGGRCGEVSPWFDRGDRGAVVATLPSTSGGTTIVTTQGMEGANLPIARRDLYFFGNYLGWRWCSPLSPYARPPTEGAGPLAVRRLAW